MNEDQLVNALKRNAVERHETDELRRAQSAAMRDMVREAHQAGLGPTRIAQEAELSRQAVYEILGQRPS